MDSERFARSVGAAAVLALGFAALLAVLAIVLPPTAAQRAAADPLVQLLGGSAWPVVAAAFVVALGWRRFGIERRDLAWALAGIAVAAVLTLAMRAIVGSRLPGFVPSEESARPGITLGLAAGLLEEAVFRLVVLSGLVLLAVKRLDHRLALVLGVLVTAALFSLSHELGPAGGVWEPRFMLTRFAIPGVVMSIAALRVNMTFLVFAHCSAHLLIPSLFPG